MSSESFSFSVNLGPPPATDRTRVIARPFESWPAGASDYLLLVPGREKVLSAPRQSLEALMLCDRFAPIDEQAALIRQNHPGWRADPAGLHRALGNLREAGVLASEAEIAAELGAGDDEVAATDELETLFVRTCRRPAALERLLESLARVGAGPVSRVVVIDDAREAADTARCRELVEAFGGRIEPELVHLAREQRRGLAADLADGDADRRALERYLLGDEADPAPTHGAPFNTALLLGAGRCMAIMDDDATLEAFTGPGISERPVLAEETRRRLALAENFEALRAGWSGIDKNPLDAHRGRLGQPVTGLVREAGSEHLSRLFSGLRSATLGVLRSDSRVRVTTNGTLGDPGTADLKWLFQVTVEDLSPLTESEARYEQLLSGRHFARLPPAPAATPSTSLMTTTLTGLDNRELLLPTLPQGRGEDLLLGLMVSFLHPGSLFMDLPFMLAHRPETPRVGQRESLFRPKRPKLADFLCFFLESLQSAAQSRSPARRAEVLRAALEDLAAAGPDRAAELIRHEIAYTRSSLSRRVRETLDRLRPPEYLARDMRGVIDAQRAFGEEDRGWVEAQTGPLVEFAAWSARTLPAWCRAWEQAAARGTGALLEACRATEKAGG